jgi:ribonuclease PH
MNVVKTSEEKYVEVQGTGEHGTFDRAALDKLLGLADGGISRLLRAQEEALAA